MPTRRRQRNVKHRHVCIRNCPPWWGFSEKMKSNHLNIHLRMKTGKTSQFSYAPPCKELNRPVHDKLDKTLCKLRLCISSSLPSLTGVRYSSRHCLHTLNLSRLMFEAVQPGCTDVTIQARPHATQTNSNDRFSISCLTAVK